MYRWVRKKLQDGQGVRPSGVTAEFGEEARSYARRMLEYLERRGAVGETAADGYMIEDERALSTCFEELLDDETTISTETSETEKRKSENGHSKPAEEAKSPVSTVKPGSAIAESITVSIPSAFRDEFDEEVPSPPSVEVRSLQETLQAILSQGSECVRLATPYLELDGINLLQSEFDRLAREDVDIKILTRGIYNPMSYETGQARDYHALYQLMQRYKMESSYGVLKIRDFQRVLRTSSEHGNSEEKLAVSVHLKGVIADDTVAYVGSGEIRDSSMYTNLEGGHLHTKSEVVSFWRDTFDFFYSRADRVNESYLLDQIS